MKTMTAIPTAVTLGLLLQAFAPQALGLDIDTALAACDRATEFCNKTSYDQDLCDAARQALPDCNSKTGSGVLCKLKVTDIAPTQLSVGKHVAACKAKAKFTKSEAKIRDYLLESDHLVPAVIGPKNIKGKRFYITDHHHLSYALWFAKQNAYTDIDTVYACVLTNLKDQAKDDFWRFLVGNHLTWLNDQNGKAISPDELATQAPDLASMADSPYRSWSRWVRDSCGYIKKGKACVPAGYPATAAYFMEFLWADYLQINLPGLDNIQQMTDQDIQQTLTQAIAVAQQPQAFLENLPGYNDASVLRPQPVQIHKGCEAE